MDYSIKNLREVEDKAPSFGFDAVQEARFAREDLSAETIGLAFHRVKAGQRQAFAHRHKQAEEIYVVSGARGASSSTTMSGMSARSTRSGSRRR